MTTQILQPGRKDERKTERERNGRAMPIVEGFFVGYITR